MTFKEKASRRGGYTAVMRFQGMRSDDTILSADVMKNRLLTNQNRAFPHCPGFSLRVNGN